MTIEDKIKEMLVSKGMWDNQADAVLAQMKVDDENGFVHPMKGWWTDDVEGYPNSLLAVLFVTADRVALQWIDENKPKAWFRPMFAGMPEEVAE